MNARQYKNDVYEQLARIGKTLSSGPRLELLDLLCQGPRSVDELAKQVGQSIANASHHLQVLRRARLVEADKEGVRVVYRLADDEVCIFYQNLRSLAESRLLEIEHITNAFLTERQSLEPIDKEVLAARVQEGDVTVLDVRPAQEYDAGHLPGALSIPLDELAQRLHELPRDREVVAYCRGPYCVMALDAVELLRAKNFKAERFDEGVSEWRARGLTIDKNNSFAREKEKEMKEKSKIILKNKEGGNACDII